MIGRPQIRLVPSGPSVARLPRKTDAYAPRPTIGPGIRMGSTATLSLARALDRGVRGETYDSLDLAIAAARHVLHDLPDLLSAMEAVAEGRA